MSVSSRFLADLYGLPKRTGAAIRHRGLMLPMRDGVELETDHYAPRSKGDHPTILMRLPYGMKGFGTVAEVYAERGFHVVLQSCRGTGKSGGEFDPVGNFGGKRGKHLLGLRRGTFGQRVGGGLCQCLVRSTLLSIFPKRQRKLQMSIRVAGVVAHQFICRLNFRGEGFRCKQRLSGEV